MKHIVIMGAGRIGRAVGGVLEAQQHHVEYWDVVSGVVPEQKKLEAIIPEADFVILCIPSWTLRECVTSVRALLKPEATVLTFSKGIERETKKTMDAVLAECLPSNGWGMIGGPMMAEEISKGMGAVAAVGTDTRKTFDLFAGLFSGSAVRVEYFADARGVALSGVLKNLYALGFGIADGLGWGINLKGWLTARALTEMHGVALELDAQSATVLDTAGVGDLICTCFSPHSRNRSVGEELIRAGKTSLQSEATVSLPILLDMLPSVAAYPVLTGIGAVLSGSRPAKEVFEGFLNLAV